MPVLFSNNAATTLASAITNVATTLTVATGTGALFPAITGSDFFYATLVNSSNQIEIVRVTARSTDTFTIVRGQEGTTARAYSTGDKVELRVTAAGLTNKLDKDGGTVTGTLTIGTGGALTNNSTNTITSGAGFTLANSHLLYSGGTGEVAIRIGASGPYFGIGTVASNNLRINSATGGDISLAIAGTTYATLQNTTGNFGVGVTSPGYRIDVASGDTTANTGYAFRIRANATATAGAIQFTDSGASAQYGVIIGGANGVMTFQGDGASSALAFRTNGNERFRINSSGGITSANLADAVGYKGIPINQQTAAYQLALSDIGKTIYATAGAFAVTIPTNATTAFPVGSSITVICEDAAKTIVPASGVTLVQAGTGGSTTGTRTIAIGGVATLVKVQTDRWYISGSGLS